MLSKDDDAVMVTKMRLRQRQLSELYYKYAHVGCPAAHMEDNCAHPDRCAENGRCINLDTE